MKIQTIREREALERQGFDMETESTDRQRPEFAGR